MPIARYLLLIDTLARYSLKADARRYFFGYLWWVLEPLIFVAVFYFVFELLLGPNQPGFLPFLIVGKLTFIWFSKSVNQAANSLLLSRGLIGQQNIPKIIFPLAILHEGFYKQLPVFGLMLVFIVIAGHGPEAVWLWLPVLALVQYLVIIAAALVAAILACWQRDFVVFINLGMVLMLFISGVFWDVASIPNPERVAWLMAVNPIAFLLEAYRTVLLDGQHPDTSHLGMLAGAMAVVIAALVWCYGRLNFWLARRVLAQ